MFKEIITLNPVLYPNVVFGQNCPMFGSKRYELHVGKEIQNENKITSEYTESVIKFMNTIGLPSISQKGVNFILKSEKFQKIKKYLNCLYPSFFIYSCPPEDTIYRITKHNRPNHITLELVAKWDSSIREYSESDLKCKIKSIWLSCSAENYTSSESKCTNTFTSTNEKKYNFLELSLRELDYIVNLIQATYIWRIRKMESLEGRVGFSDYLTIDKLVNDGCLSIRDYD